MRGILIIYLLVVCFFVAGWIMNLLAIFYTIDLPITGMFIARVIGVFIFPAGGILGWF